MLVHEVQRPFKCHTCDASFKRNPHLEKHNKVVHAYKCHNCEKVFIGEVYLKKHKLLFHARKKLKIAKRNK